MKFANVIGLDDTKAQLIRSIENNKVSHATLLLGPEGRGGLPLAIAYATFLLCENRSDSDSCGTCPSCVKMNKLIHPDVHFSYPVIKKDTKPPISLDYIKEWRLALSENPYMGYFDWLGSLDAENKQANITMDECHDIIRKFSLKAFEGKNKILILWLPEYLGKSGNSLLKIIEEPPPDSIFIFVAQNKELILNTILSRTQIIPLTPLASESIREKLISDFNLSDEEASNISYLANGNYAEAIRISKSGESSHSEEFIQWLRYCWNPDAVAVFHWTNQISVKGREHLKDFLIYGLRLLREISLLNADLSILNKVTETERTFIFKISSFLTVEKISRLSSLFNMSHYYIERNASPKIIFFNLSLQLHKLLKEKST